MDTVGCFLIGYIDKTALILTKSFGGCSLGIEEKQCFAKGAFQESTDPRQEPREGASLAPSRGVSRGHVDRDTGIRQGGGGPEPLGAKDGRGRVWRANWTRVHLGAAKEKWGDPTALGEEASAAVALNPPEPGALLRARGWGCLGTVTPGSLTLPRGCNS